MINRTSTKESNAIFLAAILIVGTFAAVSPSLLFVHVQAQPNYGMDNRYDKEPYENSYGPYYGNDNRHNSYEPEYSDKTYNSYKSDHYGKGNDYNKKSYGYESQYPSYVEKNDKSKNYDSSKVKINKIKCINTNLNINGNNAGNISLGNKGQGYSGTYNSGEGNYYNGYNSKQDKDFGCIINNNNNNTNAISSGGNATNGNVTEPQTCEECFSKFLTPGQISLFTGRFTIEQVCANLTTVTSVNEEALRAQLTAVGVSVTNANALVACLENVGVVFFRS